MKYKVGDKVKVRSWDSMTKEFDIDYMGDIKLTDIFFVHEMKKYCGKILTITYVGESSYRTEGNDWYWSDEMFEPGIICNTVIIYTEGNKVIAVDKATGRTGVAICNPQDKFDFYIGADFAFKRLMNGDTPKKREPAVKYYNGEIFCIESHGCLFTKGKIYKVKNGILYDDISPWKNTNFNSFEELNNTISQAEFIEVKK